MKNFSCLFMLGLLVLAYCQDYECPVSSPESLEIGKTAVVCIHFVLGVDTNATNATIFSYAFKTTVDKYSALKVSGIASKLKGEGDLVKAVIQFQNSNKYSSMVLFDSYDATAKKGIYREVLSFVVGLEDGSFSDFTLDNANCDVCQTADNQVCSAAQNDECFTKGNSFGGSDPVFYISWVGKDAVGNHMLSHTKRLSRFYQYSIGSMYQSAKGLVTKLL